MTDSVLKSPEEQSLTRWYAESLLFKDLLDKMKHWSRMFGAVIPATLSDFESHVNTNQTHINIIICLYAPYVCASVDMSLCVRACMHVYLHYSI